MTRTALLEIDFQPWIIELGHDPGALARAGSVRDAQRAAGALVVCTRYLSRDAADPLRSDPASDGARFHPSMTPLPGDLIATKFDRDIWSNPDLDAQLRLVGVQHLMITGYLTDFGVRIAAERACSLGYRVTVHSAACAGSSEDEHQRALESIAAAGATLDGTPAKPATSRRGSTVRQCP
ncbi:MULTISPECIES: cysteine hydrolase family protein [unclassified Rhodococcus (in: high G+C Gram-positive bacteria)]|jgi:nicotinamidase-related amidase|uniref:cysteine hydrolase family protein n=1 Tax=unclassified Rhodococcus (in: high G+C Gram-positive bacteria) TaxID=192944 RepID=UPI0014823411|nr:MULTISPECIES: cysteine hydrolase [unclassified Rhodococcus (in: high G+C Gram-positive bacteria)]